MSARRGRKKGGRASRPGVRVRWPALVILLMVATAAWIAWPSPHGWQSLGHGLGRIRWADTVTSFSTSPPLTPEWIRKLHRSGLPWPTDQPLEPLGVGFGGAGSGEETAVWYVIQSAKPSKQLWDLDKRSVRITDVAGQEVFWPGGTGSALIDSDRRLQYLYLLVPRELVETGARAHFRVHRFDQPGQAIRSAEVSLPF